MSAFLDAVDRNGSTYTYRWGDAPIKAFRSTCLSASSCWCPSTTRTVQENNEISYGIEVRFDTE